MNEESTSGAPADFTASDAPEFSGGRPKAEVQDLALDLAFVPQWARKPPGQNPYADFKEREGGRPGRGGKRFERGRDGGRGRAPGDKRPPRDRQGRGPGGPPNRDRRGGPPQGGQRRRDERRPDRPTVPLLPLDISFLPEREPLSVLVKDLHSSKRAYRLNELAHLFLSKPTHHAVKIEVRKDAEPGRRLRLYQCTSTRAVFTDKSAAQAHAKRHGMPSLYDVEELEGDAPSGNYVVIARCTLSGTLLGPPNHHSYAEKVQELHQKKFARMSLEDYRGRIETVRDPELIEQWKQEQCKREVYREKREGEQGPDMDRAAAEAHFAEHHLPALVVEGQRFIAPAVVFRDAEDPGIRRALQEAWSRESRRPYTLLRALRPALKHMHMHFFRANGRAAFITAIKPHPLAPEQTVETIGEVLQYLHAHPGCARSELVERLRPGKDAASPEVGEVLAPLRWLIERGHVIEFYNGTIAVPRMGVAGQPPKDIKPSAA